jgi:Zn-finger nucleic acid-binding protein
MSERQGVEIDYCPTCRGVWLDKIIEKSMVATNATPVSGEVRRPVTEAYYDNHEYHDDHKKYGYREKRKSWLGDLFD